MGKRVRLREFMRNIKGNHLKEILWQSWIRRLEKMKIELFLITSRGRLCYLLLKLIQHTMPFRINIAQINYKIENTPHTQRFVIL